MEMENQSTAETVVFGLAFVGALNWLLASAFDFNVVLEFLPDMADALYLAIGAAGAGGLADLTGFLDLGNLGGS